MAHDFIEFFTAFMAAVAAFLTWRTHQKAVKNADNIQKIELATNSMKDALIQSTAKASLAEGNVQGREQLKAEQNKENEKS